MKINKLKLATIALGLIAFVGNSSAQTATSSPVGYRTETIGAGFNLVGVNLHNKAVTSGTIDAESGVTINDAVDFTAILSDADATYIFEVNDGAQAGAIAEVVSSANGSVTLASALSAGNGASYSIRQAPTLNQVFSGLTGGFTAATADVVYVPTGVGGQYDTYFKHQVSGNFRAAGTFVDPPKSIALMYSDAVLVERKDAADLDIVVSGAVKTVSTVVSVPSGFFPISVSGPVGSTLQNSGLASVLNPGFTAATADVIYVPNGTPGAYDTYFVHQGTGNIRLSGTFVDAADVPVSNGLLIERKQADTAGVFTVPAFYSSL